MTAPLRAGDPDRPSTSRSATAAYDIVIGRGLLGDARRADRGAAARRASVAIVTDETVAQHHLAAAEAALDAAGIDAPRSSCRRAKAPRASPCSSGLRGAARGADRARRPRGRARRRRGRRPRRLRRRGVRAASTTCRSRPRCWPRSTPRSAARPRSIAARQEPDRRLPPAEPGARRHRACSTPCRRASSAPATPRSSSTGCSATPASSPGWRPTARRVRGRRRAREHAIAVELPRQGGDRRARRARDRRPRAAQPRPHLRPRARGGGRLRRPAAARRGGGARHGAGLPLLGAAGPLPAPRTPTRVDARISRRPACRPGSPTSRAQLPAADRLMERMRQDKKAKRGRLTFILARGIGEASSRPTSIPREVRAFPVADKLA